MPTKGESMKIGTDLGPVWLLPLGVVAGGILLGFLCAAVF